MPRYQSSNVNGEEWWISTVGVQKWCPQPRLWQSVRPQSKLMQPTAVLNFATIIIIKKMPVSHFWPGSQLLVALLAHCHLPPSDPVITRRHGKHLYFSQIFNSTVVGKHAQKVRDLVLVSAGWGRHRLQISFMPRSPPRICLVSLGLWPADFSIYIRYRASKQAAGTQ